MPFLVSPAPRAGQGNQAKFPSRSSQGPLSRMVVRVKALSLCCPLVLLCFQGESLCSGRGEASPAVHQHKDAAQTPGNVPLGRVISSAAVSCSEFYTV